MSSVICNGNGNIFPFQVNVCAGEWMEVICDSTAQTARQIECVAGRRVFIDGGGFGCLDWTMSVGGVCVLRKAIC